MLRCIAETAERAGMPGNNDMNHTPERWQLLLSC